jgi:hypothetical protein
VDMRILIIKQQLFVDEYFMEKQAGSNALPG